MTTITPMLAQVELDRRALPKGSRPSAVAHLESLLGKSLTKSQRAQAHAAFESTNAALVALAPKKAAPKVTRSAKAIRAELAPKAADPVKALRAQVATQVEPAKGSSGWWDAYRATKGMTQVELESSLRQLVNA